MLQESPKHCAIEFRKVALRGTESTYTGEVLYRSLYLQGNDNPVFIEKYLFSDDFMQTFSL